MASFPRDRFDDIPGGVDRVGAHRAPGRRGRGWIGFAWAVLATAALTVVGLFVLSTFDPNFKLPFAQDTPTPTPTPTVVQTAEPVTDPATVDPAYLATLSLAVLNGTPTQGLSNIAGDQIAAAGWPNPSRAAASNTEEATTIVYFSNPDDEGIARGIAQLVGASDVQLSDAFPVAAITIVLGADYVAPAAG